MASLFPSVVSCGDLLQSADIIQLMPEVPIWVPTATLPISIPNAPGLIGLVLYCQTAQEAHCLGSCAPGFQPGVVASNGVYVRIGV